MLIKFSGSSLLTLDVPFCRFNSHLSLVVLILFYCYCNDNAAFVAMMLLKVMMMAVVVFFCSFGTLCKC